MCRTDGVAVLPEVSYSLGTNQLSHVTGVPRGEDGRQPGVRIGGFLSHPFLTLGVMKPSSLL